MIYKLKEILTRILLEQEPFSSEERVVYFMVELRKFVDQTNEDFEVLKQVLSSLEDDNRKEAKQFRVEQLLKKETVDKMNKIYPLVRFYIEWALHHKKNKRLEDIVPIVNKYFVPEESDRTKTEFKLMSDFKSELSRLLQTCELPDFTKSESAWAGFYDNLTRVLAEQPIYFDSCKETPLRVLIYYINGDGERGIIVNSKQGKSNLYMSLLQAEKSHC